MSNSQFTKVPWGDWEKFRDGSGTGGAWMAITFRLRFNAVLAEKLYTAEALEGFNQSLMAAVLVNQRQAETGKWEATPEELEWMRAGLEAAELIQSENSIAEQLSAFRKVLHELQS